MPSIKVIARFRPINKTEKLEMEVNNWSKEYVVPISFMDPDDDDWKNARKFDGYPRDTPLTTIMVNSTPAINTNPKFTFDRVLWWDTDQEFAFEVIGEPAMKQAVEGMNCTIFAYGQSGSGKSYTTFGQEPSRDNPTPAGEMMGIIPRAIGFAFAWLEKMKSKQEISEVRTILRVFEIYIHNTIKDLLFPAKEGDKKLRIRDTAQSTVIEGLRGADVNSVEDVLRQTVVAQENRTVTCTGLNAVSSRSHCIFEFQLQFKRKDGVAIKSRCNFADLAGSEKVGKTGASGRALEEAKAINGSLTVLGRCIAELVKGKRPPFREAALSHCLKTSLSGNCMTTLIVAASPHRFNMVETINSFQFASRAKMIKTKAKKNVSMTKAQMKKEIKRLKGENKEMRAKLAKGGHKGMAVSGPEIKVVWDGAVPEQKKERAVQAKALLNYCHQTLENLEVEDMSLNVDILEKPPYTAVVTFLPDEQCDVEKCKINRDKLFEALKEDSTGPFSKHKQIDKSDPLSAQDFEQLKLRIKDLELENAGLREDGHNKGQTIIAVRKELEDAQQKLAEIQNAYDSDKRKRGHEMWRKLIKKKIDGPKPNKVEKKLKPKPVIDTSKLRNSLLLGEDVAGLKKGEIVRASTSRVAHRMNQLQPIKEEQPGALKFTDEVEQMRKSSLANAAERKARDEEHTKVLEKLLGQQNRLTEMLEERGDNSSTIQNLIEENKKQTQEKEEVADKLQEYFDQNKKLRAETKEMNAEIENLHSSIEAKEKQLAVMRSQIHDLKEQVKSVEVFENMAQQTLQTLSTDNKNHLSPEVAHDANKREESQNSLWGIMRNKLSERRAEKNKVHAQNALLKKEELLTNIFSQRDYLKATTTRYLEDEEDKNFEEKDDEPLMTIFDDDFQEEEVTDWTPEMVAEWLSNVRGGELEHLAERFLKQNVTGELLLVLKKRELQKNYRLKNKEVEIFFEELEKIVDIDEETELFDDSPEDLATSMLDEEVELLENIAMPEEDDETIWSFSQLREQFPDIPKHILVKVFCLLEKEHSGVVRVGDLRRFFQACREEPGMAPEEDCDLYMAMNEALKQFVNYKAIFKKHSPQDGLNIHGAKNILKKLRNCKEDDIRDSDLGVEFMVGLKYQDFNNILRRCPNRTWHRLANFDPFELLYQEVTKSGASRIIFKKYISAFNHIGITQGQDQIKGFFDTLKISVTRPTPYVNTFARFVLYNLTLDDDLYEEEKDILQFIDDLYRCAEYKVDEDYSDQDSISSQEMTVPHQSSNLTVPQRSLLPQMSVEHSVASTTHQGTLLRPIMSLDGGQGLRPIMSLDGGQGFHGQGFHPRMSVNRGQGLRPMMTVEGGHGVRPMMAVDGGNGLRPMMTVDGSQQNQVSPQANLIQVGPQVSQAPAKKIILNNQKLVAVRHRLMKFAVFGTSNARGFEGVKDHAFKFSSFRETVNPSQACRLNTTQARGPSAWVPDLKNPNSDNTFHVIVTLGANPKDLYAVAMQGRADKDEWVEAATVLVSLDGTTWRNLPTVHTFSCHDRHSVSIYPLYSPARCKYVKLRTEKWHNRPSLRWDCLAI
jgi:hypothetical protein